MDNFLVTEEKITHKSITKEFYINIPKLPEVSPVRVTIWQTYSETADMMDDGDTEIHKQEEIEDAINKRLDAGEELGFDYDDLSDFISGLQLWNS